MSEQKPVSAGAVTSPGVRAAWENDTRKDLSATPRTDAAIHGIGSILFSDFARTLERENNQLREERDDWKNAGMSIAVTCAAAGCKADGIAAAVKELRAQLSEANEDVLLHSALRLELTEALKLDSLKPRTRQANSEMAAIVVELKHELTTTHARLAEAIELLRDASTHVCGNARRAHRLTEHAAAVLLEQLSIEIETFLSSTEAPSTDDCMKVLLSDERHEQLLAAEAKLAESEKDKGEAGLVGQTN